MSELTDISRGANRAIVERQLHWACRSGAGQIAAFGVDVDRIVTLYSGKMDDLHARTGVSVTSAKSALATLGAAAKTDASGGVEVPAAA